MYIDEAQRLAEVYAEDNPNSWESQVHLFQTIPDQADVPIENSGLAFGLVQ